MTKKATKKTAGAAKEEAEKVRTVSLVLNRPYSAGEAPEIVEAEVRKEHDDDPDLLDLRVVNPPRGVEADVKRARRSDARTPGTWFDRAAPAEAPEEVAG